MDSKELEAKRKEEEEAKKALAADGSSRSGGDPPITKNEMKTEMRSMILELLEMGMIGARP